LKANPPSIDPSTAQRTIRKEDLGIIYGEYTLGRVMTMIDVDMVFDVGANIGQYGLLMRQQMGYRGPLISFEPIPHAVTQLKTLSSHDPSWLVKECALDDRRGRASFNVMVGDQFSSLLAPSQQFEGRFFGQHRIREVIDVDVITLDDAVSESPAFSRGLLKLDTQGNELRILKGATHALRHFSAIQLEVGFQPLYEGAADFDEALHTLNDLGYALCALFPNNHGHFPYLLEMDAIFLRHEHYPAFP
jgi:FkbM family methyltransferase